ncbi:hypothetical protein NDU88_006682 [Pleurodeles waltl]|uniref:Secreted protein n=1 Tax=Pleurodeles waltl TaxID=8319 RepID=A0AAV7TYA4_PLEWA|nr:hypothetical protein NDU88_006682 [Pleurodeles waltl]
MQAHSALLPFEWNCMMRKSLLGLLVFYTVILRVKIRSGSNGESQDPETGEKSTVEPPTPQHGLLCPGNRRKVPDVINYRRVARTLSSFLLGKSGFNAAEPHTCRIR